MDAFSTRLSRQLQQTLTDWIDDQTRLLVSTPCATIESYRDKVGEIRGWKKALELIEETERELGRPDDAAPTPVEKRRGYEE